MELYRNKKKDLHMVFIDIEKAFDRVPPKCYGSVWRRKRCRWLIFELSRIYMK